MKHPCLRLWIDSLVIRSRSWRMGRTCWNFAKPILSVVPERALRSVIPRESSPRHGARNPSSSDSVDSPSSGNPSSPSKMDSRFRGSDDQDSAMSSSGSAGSHGTSAQPASDTASPGSAGLQRASGSASPGSAGLQPASAEHESPAADTIGETLMQEFTTLWQRAKNIADRESFLH